MNTGDGIEEMMGDTVYSLISVSQTLPAGGSTTYAQGQLDDQINQAKRKGKKSYWVWSALFALGSIVLYTIPGFGVLWPHLAPLTEYAPSAAIALNGFMYARLFGGKGSYLQKNLGKSQEEQLEFLEKEEQREQKRSADLFRDKELIKQGVAQRRVDAKLNSESDGELIAKSFAAPVKAEETGEAEPAEWRKYLKYLGFFVLIGISIAGAYFFPPLLVLAFGHVLSSAVAAKFVVGALMGLINAVLQLVGGVGISRAHWKVTDKTKKIETVRERTEVLHRQNESLEHYVKTLTLEEDIRLRCEKLQIAVGAFGTVKRVEFEGDLRAVVDSWGALINQRVFEPGSLVTEAPDAADIQPLAVVVEESELLRPLSKDRLNEILAAITTLERKVSVENKKLKSLSLKLKKNIAEIEKKPTFGAATAEDKQWLSEIKDKISREPVFVERDSGKLQQHITQSEKLKQAVLLGSSAQQALELKLAWDARDIRSDLATMPGSIIKQGFELRLANIVERQPQDEASLLASQKLKSEVHAAVTGELVRQALAQLMQSSLAMTLGISQPQSVENVLLPQRQQPTNQASAAVVGDFSVNSSKKIDEQTFAFSGSHPFSQAACAESNAGYLQTPTGRPSSLDEASNA